MAAYPFQYVNRRGIPVLENYGRDGRDHGRRVLLPQPRIREFVVSGARAGRTGAGHSRRHDGNAPRALRDKRADEESDDVYGANVTVSDIPGTGVFQLWYDKQTDTLQLMTGAV